MQVLIVLVGDLYQLPPVCRCLSQRRNVLDADALVPSVCATCHITKSLYWPGVTHHTLTASIRHASDPAYVSFLDIVRTSSPTQELIDSVLQQRMTTKVRGSQFLLIAHCHTFNRFHSSAAIMMQAQALETATAETRVLCTHRDKVAEYNNNFLHKLFKPKDIVTVAVVTDAKAVPELREWLESPRFHQLPEARLAPTCHQMPRSAQFLLNSDLNEALQVAVGAQVMLTMNLDVVIGAANGCSGEVTRFEYGGASLQCESPTPLSCFLHHSRCFILARSCRQWPHALMHPRSPPCHAKGCQGVAQGDGGKMVELDSLLQENVPPHSWVCDDSTPLSRRDFCIPRHRGCVQCVLSGLAVCHAQQGHEQALLVRRDPFSASRLCRCCRTRRYYCVRQIPLVLAALVK